MIETIKRIFKKGSNDLRLMDSIHSLATHPVKEYRIRDVHNINKIIVHHSATMAGSAVAFANYHVKSNQWPGIGYHFVVNKDGTVEQTNKLETLSYHCAGQNMQSIGICCIGNFDYQDMKQVQAEALVALIRHIQNMLGELAIHGHRDFSSYKTCPGRNVDMDKVREMVKDPYR